MGIWTLTLFPWSVCGLLLLPPAMIAYHVATVPSVLFARVAITAHPRDHYVMQHLIILRNHACPTHSLRPRQNEDIVSSDVARPWQNAATLLRAARTQETFLKIFRNSFCVRHKCCALGKTSQHLRNMITSAMSPPQCVLVLPVACQKAPPPPPHYLGPRSPKRSAIIWFHKGPRWSKRAPS